MSALRRLLSPPAAPAARAFTLVSVLLAAAILLLLTSRNIWLHDALFAVTGLLAGWRLFYRHPSAPNAILLGAVAMGCMGVAYWLPNIAYPNGGDLYPMILFWCCALFPWALGLRSALIWLIWLGLLSLALWLFMAETMVPRGRVGTTVSLLFLAYFISGFILVGEGVARHYATWLDRRWARRIALLSVITLYLMALAAALTPLGTFSHVLAAAAIAPLLVKLWFYRRRKPYPAAPPVAYLVRRRHYYWTGAAIFAVSLVFQHVWLWRTLDHGRTALLPLRAGAPLMLIDGKLHLSFADDAIPSPDLALSLSSRGVLVLRRDADGVGHFLRSEDGQKLKPDEVLIRYENADYRLSRIRTVYAVERVRLSRRQKRRLAEIRYAVYKLGPHGETVFAGLADAERRLVE